MYLVYDVLQLRRSSLDNSLLVKRRDWESAERDIASLDRGPVARGCEGRF